MKAVKYFQGKLLKSALIAVILFGLNSQSIAQGITVYQLRHVPPDKMAEVIRRETTYWSKVAESAIAKGNLTFWGVFQKVGGFDMPNRPNLLFINTYNDIDAAGGIWNTSELFPDIPASQLETFSMGTVLHTFYIRSGNLVVKEGVVLADDGDRYIRFVLHNSSDPGQTIELENEHWAPFIKSSMDAGKTTQIAWVNATILAPSGPNIHANTISLDIYSSLKEALDPTWADDTVFPEDGLAEINKLETTRRIQNVYRRIQVVNANTGN